MRRQALAAALLMLAAPASARPLLLPFDFARNSLDIEVQVRGETLRMLLDTGVDPSIIDLAAAERLGLKLDRGEAGEATGFGEGKGASVLPGRIEGLSLGGRAFAGFDTLATDMAGLSAGYGRRLDGVLGYSFLADKILLIDYPGRRIAMLDAAREAAPMTKGCRRHWTIPLRTVDSFPIIAPFRFGTASAPVSLDTGSNGTIGLFQSALDLPGLREALAEAGAITRTGARGEAKSVRYELREPIGFGPFTLPPGQPVTTYSSAESRETRVANVGNGLMEALHLKLLLDYRARRMTFYGSCS